MKRSFSLLLFLFVCTLSALADITEGFYYIVSAGNGPGYSGGPYNYENKVAMYNKNGLVRWSTFDAKNTQFVYQFKANAKKSGTWFIKNVDDNTYIGNNLATGTNYNDGIYMGEVETTYLPTQSQSLTVVTPDKYFITWTGNKYAFCMANSHNGSEAQAGNLCMWGSLSSAQKYGVNVWYIKPVPQDIVDKLVIRPDSNIVLDPDTIVPPIKDTVRVEPSEGLPGMLIYSGQFSQTTYGAANAFDGNLATTFKANTQNTGWVGLDLGDKYVIDKVGYAPNHNNADKLMLGVFEGANNRDFSDAIPFHVIKDLPKGEAMTYADVDCSRGFRYVRYVGPEIYLKTMQPSFTYSEIAELRFFGEKGEGDDSHLYQVTNLPLVVFRTEADIADIAPAEKNIWRPGIVNVISENGTSVKSDTMSVKGRGNGSWSLVQSQKAKRPYKLKMQNKHRLLNMPAKAKKWTLIANWGDKTILRNNVAFNISRIFEMDYTPAISQVDVIFNGQYKGNYQLCDQIEVHKNRVEVTEMTAEDDRGENLTGGYLIELDYYAGSEPKHFNSSTYNIPVTVHYPEDDEITAAQFSYIQSEFNDLCERVNSSYSEHETKGYRPKLAVDTWLKYFLIEELCGNPDAYFSMYLYRDRGEDAQFRVSPVWDFDLAFDNDGRFHSIINNDFLCYSSSTYGAGSLKRMNQKIVANNKEKLTEIWSWYRCEGDLNNDYLHELVDSLYETNYRSAELNYQRWDILNVRTQQQYTARGSYKAEVDFLLEYLFDRIAWMDNKIGIKEPIGVHSTVNTEAQGGIHGREGYIQVRGFAEGSVVTVHSVSGAMVQNTSITEFDNRLELPKGIYIVKVVGTDGKSTVQKVAVK